MREISVIRGEISMMDEAIQNAAPGVDTSAWQEARAKYEQELTEANAYWDNQASIETRVVEAKTTGYILDTLTTSNGLTIAELSYSPENHELVCIAVQKAFLAQQDAFAGKIECFESEIRKWESAANHWNETNSSLERVNFTLEQEKQEAYQKLANATAIIDEKDAEIKALKEQQTQAQAVEVAPLSAEEQETKLINDLNGKRIKVINLHPKTAEFNNKMFIATNAITGVEFEDYLLYSKRYEEISPEEAAQLQADFQAKKEAIAKLNDIPTLETLDQLEIPPVNPVTQEETPNQEATFQPEEDVHTTAVGLVEEPLPVPGEREEESEVIPSGSYKAEHEPRTIEEKVLQLENVQSMMHEWVVAANKFLQQQGFEPSMFDSEAVA